MCCAAVNGRVQQRFDVEMRQGQAGQVSAIPAIALLCLIQIVRSEVAKSVDCYW